MTRHPITGPGPLHVTCRGQTRALCPGERFDSTVTDTYRDAPAPEMHGIIAEVVAGTPWRKVVASRYAANNPWLHRIVTDAQRDLFFRLYPPATGSRILDLGSGWGQIAMPLARHGYVCALEPTPERLRFIEAAARQDGLAERMWFVQADFLETTFADAFDLVTCIGVLEWVPRFAPQLTPIEAQGAFLARARSVIAPGGRLVIGIENRLGLKYLLGAPDDHLGVPDVAMYDAALADAKWRERSGTPLRSLTHTRAEYETLLKRAGFGEITFWSAFPDYKLPTAIVEAGAPTDQFLAANFIPEHDGIRGEPLAFQEELASHYRSLAALQISSDFAPSYFIAASPA